MAVPYDMFTAIFLRKIAEYEFVNMSSVERTSIVDGYMKSALSDSTFKKVIDYDFAGTADDANRTFDLILTMILCMTSWILQVKG